MPKQMNLACTAAECQEDAFVCGKERCIQGSGLNMEHLMNPSSLLLNWQEQTGTFVDGNIYWRLAELHLKHTAALEALCTGFALWMIASESQQIRRACRDYQIVVQ